MTSSGAALCIPCTAHGPSLPPPSSGRDVVWFSCSRYDTQNHTTGAGGRTPNPQSQHHWATPPQEAAGETALLPSLLSLLRGWKWRGGRRDHTIPLPRGGEGTVARGPVRFHPVEAIPSAPEEGTVRSAQCITNDFSCATISFYVGETKQNDITNLSSCSSSSHCFASLYPQLLSIDLISEENNGTMTINCTEPLSERTRASTLGWRR